MVTEEQIKKKCREVYLKTTLHNNYPDISFEEAMAGSEQFELIHELLCLWHWEITWVGNHGGELVVMDILGDSGIKDYLLWYEVGGYQLLMKRFRYHNAPLFDNHRQFAKWLTDELNKMPKLTLTF